MAISNQNYKLICFRLFLQQQLNLPHCTNMKQLELAFTIVVVVQHKNRSLKRQISNYNKSQDHTMKPMFGVALLAMLFAVGVSCQWSPVGAKNPRDFTGYERKYLKVHRQPGSTNYDVTTMHEIVEKSLGKKANGKKRELIEESYTTNDISELQQPTSNVNTQPSDVSNSQPAQDDYEASSVRSLRKKRPLRRWKKTLPQSRRRWVQKRPLRVRTPRRLRRSRRQRKVLLDPLPYIPPQPRRRKNRLGKKTLSSIVGFGVQLLKRAKKQIKRAKSALRRPVRRSFLALPQASLVQSRRNKCRKQKNYDSNRWKSAARPMFKNYRETNLDVTEDRDNEKQGRGDRDSRRDDRNRRDRDNRNDRNNQSNDDNQEEQEDDNQEQDDTSQNDNSSRNDKQDENQDDSQEEDNQGQQDDNQEEETEDDNSQQRNNKAERSNKRKSNKKASKKRAPLSELEL
jgi:hypothetical protein